MIIKISQIPFLKRGATHFLRFIILLVAIGVLALCVFALPSMWKGGSKEFPTASYAVYLIVIGMYATTVPFFIALWQVFKLLNLIDQNGVFSEKAVRLLKNIKYCAVVISVLYVGGVPLLFPIAEVDDAPGLLIFGMVVACAPITFAVFASVLQRLLQNVLEIKRGNNITA